MSFIVMQKSTVYISLGSNMGDRLANLHAAVKTLPTAVTVLSQSPIYETPPWGFTGQPTFLNQAIAAETTLAPLALLKHLKQVETDLGRTPTVRYGPRRIDLDILFYDDLVLQTPELTIPHPDLHERAFVLVPLADIAPGLYHPVLGKTVRELLAGCDCSGIKRYE